MVAVGIDHTGRKHALGLWDGSTENTVRAYKQTNVATARRLLQDLARRLEDHYPSAAASVREGLEETLTVLTLGLSDRLRQSLATTNAIESLISRTRACEAERQALARWTDGASVDRGGGPRSGEGLSPTEGPC